MLFAVDAGTKEERMAQIKFLKKNMIEEAETIRMLEDLGDRAISQRREAGKALRGYLDRWSTLARGTYTNKQEQ